MSKLEELLKMPCWRKWEHNWGILTKGDTLYEYLREAVRSGSIGEVSKWAEEWKSFVDSSNTEEEQEQRRRQWLTIRKLVWCAEQAATQASFYQTEIDRVCFAIEDLPNFIQEDKEWAWVCICTFLGMAARQVDVHVVLLEAKEGDKKEKGSTAILRLEVIERGTGQIAHHPAHIFCTYMDDNFRSSIEDAWSSVRDLLKEEGKEVLYDARWQLLRDKGKPLSMPRGRSASGAAALGFYHALKGTIPDKEIIVLAQVDQEGKLRGVEGVPEKVRAIVEDGRFDTIVVASEENQDQAESALKEQQNKAGLNKQYDQEHPHVELCIPPTINNLVTIRSQFRKATSEIIKVELKAIGDKYLPKQYIERPIDDIARKFLESQQKLLLIVDGAGTGKTSLCCHLTNYIPVKYPVVFISCGHIYDVFKEITRQLVFQTGKAGKDWEHSKLNPIIILDAINEFENLASMRDSITSLLKQLSGIKAHCIITCRDVSWPYFAPQVGTDFLHSLLYKKQIYGTGSFSSDRLNEFIKGYLEYFGVIGEVIGSACSSMAHPLLLRFFCEAYSGDEVGRVQDVYLKELFETYLNRKRKEICHRLHLAAPNAVDEFLEALAEIFWDPEKIQDSDKFAKLPHGGLDPVHGSLYSSLLETQILVEREHPTTTRRISFKYDEFQDFITARKIYRDIARETGTENPGPKECARYITKLKNRLTLETTVGFIFAISHDSSIHNGKEWRDVCDFGLLYSRAVIRALSHISSKKFFPGEFELLLTLSESKDPDTLRLAMDCVANRYAYLPENLREKVKPWIESGYPGLAVRIICDNFNKFAETGWPAIWHLLKRDRGQISHRTLLSFGIDRKKEFSGELRKLLEILKESADPEIRREASAALNIFNRSAER